MATISSASEVVRVTLNGGTDNLHEVPYDPRYIQRMLLNIRNMMLADEFKAGQRKGPPVSYYNWREYTIEWIQSRGVLGVQLPGRPMALDNDTGIAVQGMEIGVRTYTYLRAAPNWCRDNPRYADAEGNIVWELHGTLVAFPAALRSDFEGRLVQIGMVGQDVGDGDADLAPEHEARAIDVCVQSIDSGRTPRDILADANQDGRGRK